MLDRNFDASFCAELQLKDLGLAVEAAEELGLVLPTATTATAVPITSLYRRFWNALPTIG